MTATLILEEALRSFVPDAPRNEPPPGFVRKGRIIVGTFNTGCMRALLPAIRVVTPGEWLAAAPPPPP